MKQILFGALIIIGTMNANAENIVKSLPTKKFKLHSIGLAYYASDIAQVNTRNIPAPSYQSPGVILNVSANDSAFYYARLSPNLVLPDSRYTWTGADDTFGPSAFVSYTSVGDRTIVLNVRDKNSNTNKFRGVLAKARSVGTITEAEYCVTSVPEIVILCATGAVDANLATNWSRLPATLTALSATCDLPNCDNGKSNAAMHAYWNLLMTRDGGSSFAATVGTAHEKLSINNTGVDGGGEHNSSVMDLDNNQRGREIALSMTFATTPATDDPAGKAAIIAADNAGTMTILDDQTNLNRNGLLQPSNSPGAH